MRGYGKTTAPLTLLRKDAFIWSEEAKSAVKTLKEVMLNVLVLSVPNFSDVFILETYALRTRIGIVLS